MLLTGVHSVVLYSFSEVLINLPRLSYFVQPVFPPFLMSVVLWHRKLRNTDSFHPSTGSTAKHSAVITLMAISNLFIQILRLISTQNKQKIRRFLPHFTLNAILKILAHGQRHVTLLSLSKNHNEDILLWSSPVPCLTKSPCRWSVKLPTIIRPSPQGVATNSSFLIVTMDIHGTLSWQQQISHSNLRASVVSWSAITLGCYISSEKTCIHQLMKIDEINNM